MRLGVLALVAAGAAVIDAGAFGPAPWHEAGGAAKVARAEMANRAPLERPMPSPLTTRAATFSVFEDFPFGAAEAGRGTPFAAGADTPPIALDLDPQRFGPGRPAALLADELGLGADPAEASRGFGAEVLETVLSDPLLRDLFGPGPLAEFLADVLNAARGEGAQADAATAVAQGMPFAPSRRPDGGVSGVGLAGPPFPAAIGEPRASFRPGGTAFAPSPREPGSDDRMGEEGPVTVTTPPAEPSAHAELGAGAAPTQPPSSGQPTGGAGSASAGGAPGNGVGPGQSAPPPSSGPTPLPWPEPGAGSISIADPATGLDPIPPPWTEPAAGPALAAVPEPASLAALLFGLVGLLALGRPRGAARHARG